MTKERYIVIQEWMLTLDLNVNELIAYALIYGFCQDGESDFHGSIDYVAHWCKVGRRQAIRILNSLVTKGVVSKEEVPGHVCLYRVTFTPPVSDMPPVTSVSPQGCHLTPKGVTSMTPDNIEDIPGDNIDSSSSPRAREDMNAYGEYVRMTPANYARLVSRFGADDAARLCEILDSYLAKKPNAYRDHYRAALGWPVQRLQEEKLNQQRLKNAQEAGQRNGAQQQPYSGYGEYGLAASRRLEELLKNN